MIWRTLLRLVDEIIPSDHPRCFASWVIRWYDFIKSMWYSRADQITIIIMCLYWRKIHQNQLWALEVKTYAQVQTPCKIYVAKALLLYHHIVYHDVLYQIFKPEYLCTIQDIKILGFTYIIAEHHFTSYDNVDKFVAASYHSLKEFVPSVKYRTLWTVQYNCTILF